MRTQDGDKCSSTSLVSLVPCLFHDESVLAHMLTEVLLLLLGVLLQEGRELECSDTHFTFFLFHVSHLRLTLL